MTDPHNRELGSFDRSLPMALLKTREAVMKKFLPALTEHGLTAQQWRVIRALKPEDELTLSELSERCFLLMPSLSRIIRNLEARELVTRRSDPEDQRRSAIRLSSAGLDLFKQIEPKSVERYDHINQQFGSERLAQLYDLLDELVLCLDSS